MNRGYGDPEMDGRIIPPQKVILALTTVYTGRWMSWRNALDSDCQFRFIPLPHIVQSSVKARMQVCQLHTRVHGE